MNILIYALNYYPEPFGVGRYTGEIGAYLKGEGHDVRVITAVPHYPQWRVDAPYKAHRYYRESGERGDILRCPVFLKRPMRGIWRLLSPASFAVTSLPAVVWTILRDRPEVVVCVEPTLIAAPVALLLARLIRARSILYVQDLEVEAAFAVGHLKGGILRRCALAVERALLKGFDGIITISNRMRARIVEKGVPARKVSLVRNWVDLDVIRPLAGRNSYREEFGWPDHLLIALYAGSIGAKQALHVALDAAEALSHRDDILFVIAGEGPAKPVLERRYGHLRNVAFLPPQPEARMCDLLNLADVHLLPQSRGIADLVLPSKLGGMLASGRPILATADEGSELYEVLQSSSVVVPAGDSAAVARELEVFADGRGHHPSVRDARPLAATMARSTCLQDITTQLVGTIG